MDIHPSPARVAGLARVGLALAATLALAAQPASARGSGSIAGTVTAAATGLPLGGITVELWPHAGDRATAVTGPGGRYRFTGLPPGDYRVSTLVIAGFADEVHPGVHCPYNQCVFHLDAGEAIPLGIGERVRGIDFALETLGAIAGRAIDAASGAPLAGLAVAVHSIRSEVHGEAVTGADGGYRVEGLPPGDFVVHAGDGDGPYVDELYGGGPCVSPGGGLACNPGLGDLVAVVVATTTPGIDFALAVGGAIAGRVTGGGAPLPEVEVWVRDGHVLAIAVADGDGRYRAEGLPGGSYTLFTRLATERSFVDELYDGVPCFFFADCPRGDPSPVEVALGAETAGIDFTLEPFGTVAGTLTAAATGEPISDAYLFVFWRPRGFAGWAGPTDQDGRFSSPLPRGTYYLSTTFYEAGGPWADEVYDDVLCPRGVGSTCTADEGTEVIIRSGETTAGIDFAVEPLAGFTCRPTASGACLGGGRFWASVFGAGAVARRLPLTGDASAYTFANPANPEVAVRVIDACTPFGTFWMFATGLTDRIVGVTVIDSATGEVWDRLHLAGPFPAVLDTVGLAVCDAVFPGEASATLGTDAGAALEDLGPPGPWPAAEAGAGFDGGADEMVQLLVAGAAAAASSGPCTPAPDRLCLRDGRFAVEAEWELPSGATGAARAVPLTAQSGWFWFFRPEAPELLVKVLDGCGGDAPAYWVFAGGLTNLGVRLRVTDLAAGESREYVNSPGRPFEPVHDTAAFPTCP